MMGIWAGIKHALNSTLGTDDFKPLDKQITDRIGLIPDDTQIYTRQDLGTITSSIILLNSYLKPEKPPYDTKFPLKKSLIVNTQGAINVKLRGTFITERTDTESGSIYIKVIMRIKQNNEIIYTSAPFTGSHLNTSTFETALIPIDYVNRGDELTVEFVIWTAIYQDKLYRLLLKQYDCNIDVYGKTVIIDPTLFKTEIREGTE